jgi:hypothetical protein
LYCDDSIVASRTMAPANSMSRAGMRVMPAGRRNSWRKNNSRRHQNCPSRVALLLVGRDCAGLRYFFFIGQAAQQAPLQSAEHFAQQAFAAA